MHPSISRNVVAIPEYAWASAAVFPYREVIFVVGSLTEGQKALFKNVNIHSIPTEDENGVPFTSLTPEARRKIDTSLFKLNGILQDEKDLQVRFCPTRNSFIGFHDALGDDVLERIVHYIASCQYDL